jgi:hypothetical protein
MRFLESHTPFLLLCLGGYFLLIRFFCGFLALAKRSDEVRSQICLRRTASLKRELESANRS